MIRVNDDVGAALAELAGSHTALRDHSSSMTYTALVRWIEALAAAQQAAMTSIRGPEKLEAAQIRLQQILAMRAALSVTPGALVSTGYLPDQ